MSRAAAPLLVSFSGPRYSTHDSAPSPWAQLAALIAPQVGGPVLPRRLSLSRTDFEALRDASLAVRDDRWKFGGGPTVEPVRRKGHATYDKPRVRVRRRAARQPKAPK